MIIDDLRKQLYALQMKRDEKAASEIGTIRYLMALMKNKEIELRPNGQEFTDETALDVIRKEIKTRKKNMEIIKSSGRQDIVAAEETELAILEKYLEKYASENE